MISLYLDIFILDDYLSSKNIQSKPIEAADNSLLNI